MTSRNESATQARLPVQLEDRTPMIATMEFGHTAWVAPWAMWADRDRLLWLHPDYEVFTEPKGTVQMRVMLQRDGYHVWAVKGRGYKPQDKSGYVGGPSQPFIPVAEIHL